MKKSRSNPFSRRAALKAAAGCGLMSNTALMSQFLNLQATKAMASTSNPTGYKAIVCVFLAGAIDSFNVLVPRETQEYADYLTARNGERNTGNVGAGNYNPGEGLGLRDEDFADTTIMEGTTGANTGGREFGLHYGCSFEANPSDLNRNGTLTAPYFEYGLQGADKGIAQLYKQGNLAFVANVGSLPYKFTRAQYNANEFGGIEAPPKPARPLGLFSHSDLQRHWQTSVPQSRAQVNGWGGRLSDCFAATNTESAISMNMSINGVNIFQTGSNVTPYTVGLGDTETGEDGANVLNNYGQLNNYENRAFNALTDGIFGNDVVQRTYADLVADSFRGQNRGSIDAAVDFNIATNSISFPDLDAPFEYGGGGASDLSRRLRQVARIIGCSSTTSNQYNAGTSLAQTRQVFFVQEGGWDHHQSMIGSMDNKIHEVSKALTSFYRALEYLGVESEVVTFTASDFGRTLRTNSSGPNDPGGSDHAWGGNHIIMGGQVDGGKIYGKYPTNLNNAEDPDFVGLLDVGQKRIIPTTGVDEFAAEMARWFGIDNQNDLKVVLPNVGEFYSYNAGAGPLGILP